MKAKTKLDLQKALVEIMNYAMVERDLSGTTQEYNRWERVVDISSVALGEPTAAEAHKIKKA